MLSIVPQDIVGVRPRSPARVRRSTPCRFEPEGQTATARCGNRDWFSDHLFVESQDGHARTGYGTSITAHLAAVAALIAFVLAQPDVVTIHMPSLPMPAVVASLPPPPIETVSVQLSSAQPKPKTTVDAPAPPPPERTAASSEESAPAPVDAPAGITPETGAESRGAANGAPGGVPGGVVGGVPGGVVGGSAPSGSGTGTVVRVGSNLQPPRKIKNVTPVYPAGVLPSRSQGAVVLEVTIGPEGKVTHVKVMHSVPALDQAAIDAVRQWEYTPTVLNGVAVSVIMNVAVNFMMQ